MDHLKDNFIGVNYAIIVPFVLKSDQRADITRLFKKPSLGYNDFVAFLEQRKWSADRERDFELEGPPIQERKAAKVKKDEFKKSLDKQKDPVSQLPSYNKHEILQAWLFFALIACVIRIDKEPSTQRNTRKENGGHARTNGIVHSEDIEGDGTVPVLRVDDLINEEMRKLSTEALPMALQKWHDWMKTGIPRARLRAHLIEADRTLELARRVIRANLVSRPKDADRSYSSAGGTFQGKQHRRGSARPRETPASSDSETTLLLDPPESNLTDNQNANPQNETRKDPFPELSLCLMVLGETLSAAKTHIMNDLGLYISGWLVDDDDGWGPPSYVQSEIEKKWCPRAQTVLQGQLGSSAILLFAAWEVRLLKSQERSEHRQCTAMECLHVPGLEESEKGKVFYKPRHYHNSVDIEASDEIEDCLLQGPDMTRLYSILKPDDKNPSAGDADFPIFRIVTKESDSARRVVGVTVERWRLEPYREQRKPNFTAISHVWSQGMGNERTNELQECHLELILTALEATGDRRISLEHRKDLFVLDLLSQVLDDDELEGNIDGFALSPPFWMDALAIPVKQPGSPRDFKDLKLRAIRQIYHVFNMASRVVVIDKDLLKEKSNTSFQVIIKALTSAWMQRLWTLQESYLSRRLYIAFWGPGDSAGTGVGLTQSEQIGLTLVDVDKRVRDLDRLQKDAFTTSMAELIKRKFFHNVMGEDRQIRNRNDHPIETRGSMVIASAWRSSRWRNTSRPEDETLALSTLLNLDYRTTAIENASAKEPAVIEKAGDENPVWLKKDGEGDRRIERANMMKDFWTLIHKNYEGSIPAGLIFLPGEKMSLPGFGWAPTTWMSARDESYPYPLSMMGKPTELHGEGLLVQYPGFLLQCGDPHVILGSNWGKQGLTFPIDQYISEWYKVSSIGRGQADDRAARKVLPRIFANTSPEFGIILCRPKPREWPPEIGLLVEIYREAWKRKEPERVNRKYYYCQIIRRVWVSRIATPVQPKNYKLPSGRTGNAPIGELMPENTLWYVDGYLENRNRGNLSHRPPPLVSDARDSAIDMGHATIQEDKRKGALAFMRSFTGLGSSVSVSSVGTAGAVAADTDTSGTANSPGRQSFKGTDMRETKGADKASGKQARTNQENEGGRPGWSLFGRNAGPR